MAVSVAFVAFPTYGKGNVVALEDTKIDLVFDDGELFFSIDNIYSRRYID